MMNFYNKYLTWLTIAFLIFLLYKSNKNEEWSSFTPTPYVANSGKEPTFSYKIDPGKDGKNLSFIDKVILKYLDNKIPPKYATKPETQPQKPADPNQVVKQGDQVKIIYRPHDAKDAEPDPINIIVGHHQIPQKSEEALIGLKVGDVRMVEIDKEHNNYTRIEVLAINAGGFISSEPMNNQEKNIVGNSRDK